MNICLKTCKKKTVNSSIRMYRNKIENIIVFNLKTVYHLKVVTPQTMKLLESTKSKKINTKIVKMFLT